MIELILIGALLLVLAVNLVIELWLAANQRWEARAEEARLDREVRLAERRLHNIASQAFGSMLEADRGQSSSQREWHQ